MLHPHYLDTASGPIGRVVTSEDHPATAHEFYFWTAETEAAQSLDIGHIVAAESEDATAIAVLDDPRRYSDLQSFLDDFYAFDGDPSLPALSDRVEILVFRARVLATKHREERKKSKRPVKSGPVYFATSAAIEFALGAEEFSGTKIPMLLHENGNETNGAPQRTPLYADADYLMGPEAGHLNITGMSGLSTKTSHALFTISSIFQSAKDKKVAALMFNEKGLPPEDREMYEALGLRMEPFKELTIFAPLAYGQDPQESTVYPSDIPTRRLNTLRTARGEDTNVHPILWDLGDVLPHAGRIFDPTDYDDKFRGFVEYLISSRVESMGAFYGEINAAFDYFDDNDSSYWNGHHQATIAKVRNRFDGLPSKCQGLLVNGRVDYKNSLSVEDTFKPNEMRVVDISRLTGVPQDLVVTKVVKSIWEKAERNELGVDKLIIFVDELNKYAPSGSRTSSLKDTLVDISARGRHLKLTLFGAQQFRSKVDDEVVGNAATSLYGRVGDEELTNAAYRSFSQTVREELLQLEKGCLLLRHAHYSVPVFGRFPRPAVLMGAQGTAIYGQSAQDPATSVLNVMRNLTSKLPKITAIRSDIEGAPEERIYEALDAVSAAFRSGKGAADPYKNFVWNLKKPSRTRRNGGDASRILSGLDRMRD